AVQMISKVAKEVDLQLLENALSLIAVESASKGGLQMKISIDGQELFSEYVMGGVSSERNEIHLEVPVGLLAEVLKHAASAQSFKVHVIPVADWMRVSEQDSMDAKIRSFQVHQFRMLVERIKCISNTCILSVIKKNDGDMELKASAEIPQQVRVATTFKEIQYPAG
ncbi:checkpoint protein HUS1-like, partial [Tropilaelaps mercedesae]